MQCDGGNSQTRGIRKYTLIHKLYSDISLNNVPCYRTIIKHEFDGKKTAKFFQLTKL